MNSFFFCKKNGPGALYKECRGVSCTFFYKVFLCDEFCKPENCRQCHELENRTPIDTGKVEIVIGSNQLHSYIENALLSNNYRRGSVMSFALKPEDAFEDIGIPEKIPANRAICCYLDDASI